MNVAGAVEPISKASGHRLHLHDETITNYVFETGLVIDGRRERHSSTVSSAPCLTIDHTVPLSLRLGTRVYVDPSGIVHLCGLRAEPAFERKRNLVVVRRLHREIELEGDSNLLWHLLRELDGTKSSDELIHALPESTRDAGLHLLSMLIEAGALDASGRSTASFLHYATKKGNLPGTDLDLAEILTLVTDGDYRSYPERPRVVLGDDIPESVQGLRTLLRTRRSCRDFNGSPISRTEFDTILSTAAGVTGSLEWAGRRTHLRAYPSSGGLYAVELYPVVFGVAGLNSGVYHYRSVENALTLMHDDFYADNFISAALPSEREMLSGVAVMFCLTGVFVRHECKYGAGGYRMLVAEAGHLSQNLILSSVALDLDARPFGGVFDEMVNSALGLNTSQEQFLLSVIVGHAGVRNQ